MTGLDSFGARAGAKAVAAAAERIARVARDEVPDDVRVEQDGGNIVLHGRDLRARSIDDTRLRGFGLLAGNER